MRIPTSQPLSPRWVFGGYILGITSGLEFVMNTACSLRPATEIDTGCLEQVEAGPAGRRKKRDCGVSFSFLSHWKQETGHIAELPVMGGVVPATAEIYWSPSPTTFPHLRIRPYLEIVIADVII